MHAGQALGGLMDVQRRLPLARDLHPLCARSGSALVDDVCTWDELMLLALFDAPKKFEMLMERRKERTAARFAAQAQRPRHLGRTGAPTSRRIRTGVRSLFTSGPDI